MSVPETPVNEHDLSKPPEHQIGLARKIRRMQPVAKSHRVHHPPHCHFRRRIHPVHTRHMGAAFGGAQFIHGVYSRLSPGRYPALHLLTEKIQRQCSVAQDGIVKFANIELRAKLLFGLLAQLANTKLSHFVGERLCRP